MTCVGKLYIAGGQIQNAHPSGNKHTGFVIFTKLFICLCENIVHRHAAFRKVFNNGLGGHHKHGRRNSLAGNISGKKRHRGITELIEIVEVAAHFLRRDHLRIDAIGFIVREVGGKCRKLNLFCVFQLLVDSGSSFCNIAFKCRNSRVDIIGQRGELFIGANINSNIQITLGDPTQGIIDFLQVVNDHPFDQYVNKYKQSGKDKHLHENTCQHRGIPHKHSLRNRHGSQQAISLNELEHIHILCAQITDAVHNICAIQRSSCFSLQHLLGRNNADGRDMLACISVIDHHAKLLIQHRNKATRAYMAVFGDIDHKGIEHLMELLRIVAHLKKAAICKPYRCIFSPHRFVLASGRILLHKGILHLQHIHKFFGLCLAVHIVVVDNIFLCGIDDHAFVINNIDFLNIVFFRKIT